MGTIKTAEDAVDITSREVVQKKMYVVSDSGEGSIPIKELINV